MPKGHPVSPEQFVRAWMEHGSLAAVASALKMTISSTQQLATRLRKRGVMLPSKRTKHALDIEGLNKIIREW